MAHSVTYVAIVQDSPTCHPYVVSDYVRVQEVMGSDSYDFPELATLTQCEGDEDTVSYLKSHCYHLAMAECVRVTLEENGRTVVTVSVIDIV